MCGFGCPETHGHGSAPTECSGDGERGTEPSCKAKVRGMCESPGQERVLGRVAMQWWWGSQPHCLVSAFHCLQQNPPATQSTPTSGCPAAPLWLHAPAGCRWIGWEQARNRLSCWEPGILCPILGQLAGKANLGYLSVCCRQSCSITLIL